jgi:hypothetical protein
MGLHKKIKREISYIRTIIMQTENMNSKMTSTVTQTDVPGFPVGYYQLHPDRSLNWQMK